MLFTRYQKHPKTIKSKKRKQKIIQNELINPDLTFGNVREGKHEVLSRFPVVVLNVTHKSDQFSSPDDRQEITETSHKSKIITAHDDNS